MGILPWVWYGGAKGVAVLYSVVNAGVREFWVKTAEYDRKVGEESDKVALPFTGSIAATAGDESYSVSATITVEFSADSGTTITPSTFSYSATASAGADGVQAVTNPQVAIVEGQGPVTATVTLSATGSGDSLGIAGFGVALGVVGLASGYSGEVVGSLNGVGSTSSSGSATITNFAKITDGFLNRNYALIRLAGLLVNGIEPDFLGFDSLSIDGDLIEIEATSGIDSLRAGFYLAFAGASNQFKVYRVASISGSTVSAALALESSSSPVTASSATILFSGAAEITYGLHTVESGTTVYDSPPLPSNDDDWRKALVSFAPPALGSLSSCLADAIYLPDGILTGGNLYRIDLDQIISGSTLRDRLQSSAATVTATLTTQTATSGETCTLGTAAESTVQVPSPGRGTIEGITYLP